MIARLKKSFKAQGFNYIIDIIKTILLVPFFLSNWGLETYGNYLSCLSFLALLMSFDNGFGIYVSNEYNLLFHKDVNKARHLISSALKAVILSSIIQTFLIFTLILIQYNLSFFFIDIEILYALLVMCIYRLFFGTKKGLLVKTLFPIGYFHRSSLIGTIEKIIEILVLIPFIIYNNSFLNAIIFICAFKSIYCLVSLFFICKWTKIPFFKTMQNGKLKEGLQLYKKSLPIIFNSFFDKSTNDGINSIISFTIGTAFIPIYTSTKTLSNALLKIFNLFLHPIIPEFGRLYSKNQDQKIISVFKVTIILITLAFLPMLFFSHFSEYIYNFWLNSQLEFNDLLFSTLISSSLIYMFGKIFVSYFVSINNVLALTIISLIRGIGILSLSYILLYFFGINGLGWSNLIAETISFVFTCLLIIRFWKNKNQLFSNKEIYIYSVNIIIILIGLFISTILNNISFAIIISLIILILNFKSFKNIYKILKTLNDK